MAKAKSLSEPKLPDATVITVEKPLPSVEEFRAAVKYLLMTDHGMPALYADEILDDDPEFLERHRQTYHEAIGDVGAVERAADGFRFDPPKGLKWVSLQKGQCVAEENQIVLDVNGAVDQYLDSLVALGLHGEDRNEVATAMLAKGIESVFPLILSKFKTKEKA